MPHPVVLDFERPVVELERKIKELRGLSAGSSDLVAEIERLENKARALRSQVFDRLTPWQQVQLARHPARPRPSALLDALIEELTELRGDRIGADDPAVIAGLGYCDRRAVAVLGHGRGRRAAGGRRWTALPDRAGLRKAHRLVTLAGRFELPLILLVDVADDGAAEADRGAALGPPLAELLAALARLNSPTVALVTGEAYGALGAAFLVADRVLVLEHAVCSPVTPETCATRDFGDPERFSDAAQALRLTSEDVRATGFCHGVVDEPLGGAHRDPEGCQATLRSTLRRELTRLSEAEPRERLQARRTRLQTLGQLVAVSG